MDQPPPNYNPNDSMLSGGTETIMKVMGGGYMSPPLTPFSGGGAPPGYNETVSLLDGGTEPIVMVKGGAIGGQSEGNSLLSSEPTVGLMKPDVDRMTNLEEFEAFGVKPIGEPSEPVARISEPVASISEVHEHKINVRFVSQFERVDEAQKQKFISKMTNLQAVNVKLQQQIDAKPEVNLAYIKNASNTYDITVIASDKDYEKVKFIPNTVREIIVLPPTETVGKFLEVLLYLTNNKYITIKNNALTIKKRVFIVHLMNPPVSDDLKYLYLRLKVSNINKYYIADYPYKIIYPQSIDKKILLITNEGLKKPATTYLEPTNMTAIQDTFIKQMAYPTSDETYELDDFLLVKAGSDSTDTSSPIMLTKNIAVIEVKENDFNTILFDINGVSYRIRVPDGKNDVVYALWINKKYTPSEEQVLRDLHIHETPEKAAEILFELAYFKCFNDVSLLTVDECSSLRKTLQAIYKHKLKKDEEKVEKTKDEGILIVNHKCYGVQVGNNIKCGVTYMINGEPKTEDIYIPYKENAVYVEKPDRHSDKHIRKAILHMLKNKNL